MHDRSLGVDSVGAGVGRGAGFAGAGGEVGGGSLVMYINSRANGFQDVIATVQHGTWIYFQVVDRRSVKIGKADDVERRREQHARTVLDDLEVRTVAQVRGLQTDERYLKKYFRKFRFPNRTETFHPVDEITDYIRWLRNQYFVAVESTTEDELAAMPIVESTVWLPDETRRLAPEQLPLGFPADPFDFPPRVITGDDFYTNEIIIDAARATLGGIDLDPASHATANKCVKATRFYTIGDNGLSREWAGRVWLNPPFSQWQDWVPKILGEWRSGRIESMCVLSAMRTVTAQYFHPLMEEASAMCIIKGRIKFWGGRAGDSPDDGHAIFYFGNDIQRFKAAFAPLGRVW